MTPSDAMNQNTSKPDLETRRRRLLFRATHRGTHENDLLIGGFVAPAARRPHARPSSSALEAVLDLPDPDLADWLTRPSTHAAVAQDRSPMLRAMVEAAGKWPEA